MFLREFVRRGGEIVRQGGLNRRRQRAKESTIICLKGVDKVPGSVHY
jgi:hypothetical protein